MSAQKAAIHAEDHIQGDPNAEFTLLEYGDYECPHCGRAYPIVKQVQEHFGRRLCFAYRNFPLNEIHPHAESAAETAEFAADHEKFWEMHDLLFENQRRLGIPLYEKLAQELNLDPAELDEALDEQEYTPRVRADFSSGVRAGVNGTPTFFINGQRHNGSYEYEDLIASIEASVPS